MREIELLYMFSFFVALICFLPLLCILSLGFLIPSFSSPDCNFFLGFPFGLHFLALHFPNHVSR